MRTPLALIALLIVAGTTVGCGPVSTSLAWNYYTLDYQPRPSRRADSERPYPFVLEVGRLLVDQSTNRMNIVYRYSPHQLQYYEQERWAVRPDDMVRQVVLEHLETAGLTRGLGTEFFDARPDFRIDGTVDAIERLGAGDLYFGHLAMTLRVVRIQSREDVWSYSFDRRRRVDSPDMVHTVRAISDILQAQMNVVVAELDSLFLAAKRGEALKLRPVVARSEPGAAPAETVDDAELDDSTFVIIREP